jgi:hypothetical protein
MVVVVVVVVVVVAYKQSVDNIASVPGCVFSQSGCELHTHL